MTKITYNKWLLFIFAVSFSAFAQEQKGASETIFDQSLTQANQEFLDEYGVIKCATTEHEKSLQAKYPERANTQDFENWLAPKIQNLKASKANGQKTMTAYTIPIIFHILTDGEGFDNLDATYVEAQIDQLNIDYSNMAGSTYDVAGDAEIQFCAAAVDPDGEPLLEPGINRVEDYGDGPFERTQFEIGIKANTQWDPTQYLNVWVGNGVNSTSGPLLGYAQFPSTSGLPGMPNNGGDADTDGVVIVTGSVGSLETPNPSGAYYASGRTLTHEVGHWLGLRHIWGDGGCSVDDFCEDTPNADGANSGCPVANTCFELPEEPDMVENYMDYTSDSCMNTLTQDQVDRIQTVMENSPRRMELGMSMACIAEVFDLDGMLQIENTGYGCSDITPSVKITNIGNNELTSATIEYGVEGGDNDTYAWSGNLANGENEIVELPAIALSEGDYTLNITLTEPNGSTDENTTNNAVSSNFSITGGHCTSEGTTEWDTGTTGVEFGDISNLDTGKPSGYSDYTDISTDVEQGEVYDINVYGDSDGEYQLITYVWIDWNQNCSFEDEGEQYDLGTSADVDNELTANSPLSITVPEDAVLGSTTMRVTSKYSDSGANQFPTSCENNHDAEVEDYTVNVTESMSVNGFDLKNQLTLYPNPTSEVLNIKMASSELPDNYTVYNMLGQVVAQKAISSQADLSVPTSQLSNGMYLIEIAQDGNQATLRFVKK